MVTAKTVRGAAFVDPPDVSISRCVCALPTAAEWAVGSIDEGVARVVDAVAVGIKQPALPGVVVVRTDVVVVTDRVAVVVASTAEAVVVAVVVVVVIAGIAGAVEVEVGLARVVDVVAVVELIAYAVIVIVATTVLFAGVATEVAVGVGL